MTIQSSKKLKSILMFSLVFLIFLGSRVWVLQHPPASYSDVSHDYERYANMWRYGLTPYREHLFEYPPVAVPLLSMPLDIDQMGIGYYYVNYRIQIFLFEIILFGFLFAVVSRLPTQKNMKILAIVFYILAGMIAKDFWYEGLDLIFFGTFSIMLSWVYLIRQDRFLSRTMTWVFFWLSVGLKIVTGPLLVPIFLVRKLEIKKELLSMLSGAVIVWGIPIILYRSSLSVFLVALSHRPMKYGAFGSFIVDVINNFTHTEVRIQEAPDFQWVGPVADIISTGIKFLFPVAVLLIVVYSWRIIKRYKKELEKPLHVFTLLVQFTLLYVFVLFLTGKTFSSPFHIWYVPLLALYPYNSTRSQLFSYALALLMLGLDTTPYLKVPNVSVAGPLLLTNIRDAFRFIPMGIFIALFLRWIQHERKYSVAKRKR